MNYEIHLKSGIVVGTEIKNLNSAGLVTEGLIIFGNVVVSLNEFKCAFPIEDVVLSND